MLTIDLIYDKILSYNYDLVFAKGYYMFPGFTFYFPEFFPAEKFFLSSYSLCAIIGLFTACPISIYYFKKRTGDIVMLLPVLIFGAVGTFLGMHLLYGIVNISHWGELQNANDFWDLMSRIGTIFGGSVFYGGLFGYILFAGLYAKLKKLPLKDIADVSAPMIAVFHGFGRIGCFMGGCCYGIEWEHGIMFENALVESANGVPRVPVQLIEAGFEFALGIFLWIALSRRKFYGILLNIYLLIYASVRFFLEFLRGDEYRGFFLGLSTSQIISIAVVAAMSIYFIRLKVRKTKA